MSDYRYDAFISYRHVEPDRAYAKWLHKVLETYRVPKDLVKQGFPKRIQRVFRDEEELPASSDLSSEINTALVSSKFLIVICSPRIVESIWCDAEVKKFRELGRHNKILALLIEGEPSESFLPSLCEIRKNVVKEDGSKVEEIEAVEPLAADVRPSRHESSRELKNLAKLRILACILGCKFDELRKREQIRRRRRAIAFSSTLLILLLCMTSLALWALKAESVANEQRLEAEKNGAEAQKQKSIAEQKAAEALSSESKALKELKRSEELSGFMLFRLRNELYSLGRSDLLRDIAEKNLEYYLSRNVDSLDNEQKYRIAIALANCAEAVILQGEIQKASQSYEKSVNIFNEICRSEPQNKKWKNEKSEITICYANSLEQLGEKEKALELVKASVNSLMSEVKEKGEEDNVVYTAHALYRLAEYHQKKGDLEQAVRFYRSNLAKLKQYTASKEHREKLELHRMLALTLKELGQIELDRNNLSSAYDYLKTCVDVMRWLLEQDDSNRVKHNLVQCLHSFSVVNTLKGRNDVAEKDFTIALNIMKELVSVDQLNIEWQLDLAKTSLALGILHKQLDNFEKAVIFYAEGSKALHKAASIQSEDKETRYLLIEALLDVIEVNFQLEKYNLVKSSLAAVKSLLAKYKQNHEEVYIWKIKALTYRVSLSIALNRLKEAESYIFQKVDLAAEAGKSYPENREIFMEWVYAQQNLIKFYIDAEKSKKAVSVLKLTVKEVDSKLRRYVDDVDMRWSLSELYETMALLNYGDGELKSCLSNTDAALMHLKHLYKSDPEDLDCIRTYALMLKSKGVLLSEMEKPGLAASLFKESLKLMKGLIIKTPEDKELSEIISSLEKVQSE